ncbi:MAG: DUF45 domain-containing protein [Acidobacteria bacterium]|nr:DUF45 domain-containing protein [Acidobacteriota bacterium]MCA1608847.1 DUF45 domain-containing protein [Acidobacteriota bacterium]
MPDVPIYLAQFYHEAFRNLAPKSPTPETNVRFYPYVGINHTIRLRGGRIYVRIAEICRDMPAVAHRALAFILVAKLLRKKVPAGANEVYDQFTKTPEMRARATAHKRIRGRKVLTPPAGSQYDLSEIFDRLNRMYFDGKLAKPVLSWSATKTYRNLGHHDSTHETVVISRSLDSAEVPGYVVDYVVFHEMLHIQHPTVHHNGRRYNHTPAFRHDEEKFEHFARAERWIERNVWKLKRQAKRKR